jgi:hypothetical protein
VKADCKRQSFNWRTGQGFSLIWELLGTSSAHAEHVVGGGDGGTFEDGRVLMSEHADRWEERLETPVVVVVSGAAVEVGSRAGFRAREAGFGRGRAAVAG